MNDEFSRFFEAAKALITYIDSEQVFDKSAAMGCGGYDTYQSELFYDLIANARNALKELESTLNTSQ
jgi:hypothetical protein